jgi:hypothetical protein
MVYFYFNEVITTEQRREARTLNTANKKSTTEHTAESVISISHWSILMLSSNFGFSLPSDRSRKSFHIKILSARLVLETHQAICLSLSGLELGAYIPRLILNMEKLISVAMGRRT